MRIFAVGTKIFGGPGQHLGACSPGPNVEPPLILMLAGAYRIGRTDLLQIVSIMTCKLSSVILKIDECKN